MKGWLVALAGSLALAGAGSSVKGATVGQAKLLPDGATITIEQCVVSAVGQGFVYLADPLRASGIRATGVTGLQKGHVVSCAGTLGTTVDGERVLAIHTAQILGTSSIKPLFLQCRWAGGADLVFDPASGAGQRGMTGGNGANTVGQLVRVAGRLLRTESNGTRLVLDDGSVAGGLGVELPESVPLEEGIHLSVTGICSLRYDDTRYQAVILVTDLADLIPTAPNLEMLFVPDGPFLMGNTGMGMDAYEGLEREFPAHEVYVPAFWISKTEVTRRQYRSFIQAGGYWRPEFWSAEGWAWRVQNGRSQPDFWAEEQWWDYTPGTFRQTDNHPVIGVSFYEAEAFARWAGCRLPTEAEWEKAARWDGHSRVYPWGDLPDDTRCNDWFDRQTAGMQTAAVGSYPQGVSPFGCLDMAGNVWEWTASWYRSFPGASKVFDRTGELRVLKGGSWYGMYGTRAACRYPLAPWETARDVGFRVAR